MMQFNVVFIVTALLVSAAPAMAVTLNFYAGADCTGSEIATSQGTTAGECIYLANGGSAKSISYSGVPHSISFYESGGAHDICTNGATLVLGSGSGCGTAPAGFNFESVSWA